MIGFPEDTRQSILRVIRYAMTINPTFANFNLVTPYPGTEFFEQIRDRIADFDFSHYSIYTPVLKYEHLPSGQVTELHAKCFKQFYFRWQFLFDNAHLFWPILERLGIGPRRPAPTDVDQGHPGVPKPLSGPDLLRRKGLRQDKPHQQPGS